MAPAMRRIALRAGCITLGSVRQYIKIVHLSDNTIRRYLLGRTAHRPLLRRLIEVACTASRSNRFGSRLLNACRDINLNRSSAPDRSTSAKHAAPEIVEVELFGSELDRFWAQVRHEYPAISTRNARFLNWRYVDAPDLDYRRFIARRAGQCIGYIVIRRASAVELPAGVVVDFLTSRSNLDVVKLMIERVENFFGSEVEFLDCATSVPEFGAVLEKSGFFRAREERPTIVCRDPLLRGRIQALKDDWFFTKGDQDWDQVLIS
jgi:hypothetical protein